MRYAIQHVRGSYEQSDDIRWSSIAEFDADDDAEATSKLSEFQDENQDETALRLVCIDPPALREVVVIGAHR
jgi:ribulose bisphosphate carboxylase small subunit